jgi:hypothetical protein
MSAKWQGVAKKRKKRVQTRADKIVVKRIAIHHTSLDIARSLS